MIPSHIEKLVLNGTAQIFTKNVGFSGLTLLDVPKGKSVVILNIIAHSYYNNQYNADSLVGIIESLMTAALQGNNYTQIDNTLLNRLICQYSFYNNESRQTLTHKPDIEFAMAKEINKISGLETNFVNSVTVKPSKLQLDVFWCFKSSVIIQTIINPLEPNSITAGGTAYTNIDDVNIIEPPYGLGGINVITDVDQFPPPVLPTPIIYAPNTNNETLVTIPSTTGLVSNEYLIPIGTSGSADLNGELLTTQGTHLALSNPVLTITYALINVAPPTQGFVPNELLN